MQISQETTSYQQLHTSQVTVQTYSVVQAQEQQSTTDLGEHSQGGNLPSQEETQESRSRSRLENETDNEKNSVING